jgi:selenide,water dikinase
VGSATGDDAGVYRLDARRALVQTVDFFTPVVDDPYAYGQIAAANSLSDVYAMGGRPLTALNLLGLPDTGVPECAAGAILRGGAAKMKEAGCLLVGGHSVRNPEPFYGLAVTGVVHPRRLITNTQARPGDHLILTKPLGSGIVSTGVKRDLATPTLARRMEAVMRYLNQVGAVLGERGLVRAGTDVTGFGLLGHLGILCRESGVGAELEAAAVPVIGREVFDLIERGCVPGGTRQNLNAAEEITEWRGVPEGQRLLLADAQTSGGLLLAVAPRKVALVLDVLRQHRTPCAALIGRVVASRRPRLRVRGV